MANVTDFSFVHDSREAARIAAEETYSYNLDEIILTTNAEGKWGWVLVNEPVEDEVDIDAQLGSLDEPVVDVEESEDDVPGTEEPEAAPEAESQEAIVEQPEPAAPADPPAQEQSTAPLRMVVNNAATPDAQPGDVVLQAGGPNLTAHQRALAVSFANKLGVEVYLRDARSYAVLDVVKPRAGGGGKGGGRSFAPPTEAQQKIIDLCTRASGATSKELHAALANPDTKVNETSWGQKVKACERFGFKVKEEPRRQNNRWITVWFLVPADADEEAA